MFYMLAAFLKVTVFKNEVIDFIFYLVQMKPQQQKKQQQRRRKLSC